MNGRSFEAAAAPLGAERGKRRPSGQVDSRQLPHCGVTSRPQQFYTCLVGSRVLATQRVCDMLTYVEGAGPHPNV